MASLLLFTVVIDIYTATVRQLCIETIPRAFRVLRRIMLGRGKADQLVGMVMFFASASISFMLLIKGQELMIEAIVWFLVSIGRPIFGHLVIHRHPK